MVYIHMLDTYDSKIMALKFFYQHKLLLHQRNLCSMKTRARKSHGCDVFYGGMIIMEVPALQPLNMAMAQDNRQQRNILSVSLFMSSMIPQGVAHFLFDRLLCSSAFFPEENKRK